LCDEASVLQQTRELPGVRCVLGPQGSSVQRNTAIPLVRTQYTLYLDDDVELAPDYIERMEHTFAQDPLIAAAAGGAVANGAASGHGIGRADAVRALLEYQGSRASVILPVVTLSGYNMFVRTEIVRTEQFDEKLPLYAWLEDRDFIHRCARHGKIVRDRGALIAHLGTRSGRTSDVKYGYSKIANPWYLWRKSAKGSLPESTGSSPTAYSCPPRSKTSVSASEVLIFWLRTTIGNAVRALMPKPPHGADYKKRLAGNLMAYRDLVLFRIDPQNILKIQDSTALAEHTPKRGAWRTNADNSTQ
jgi:glycosyltransferase involved in cell wall biosynthesis